MAQITPQETESQTLAGPETRTVMTQPKGGPVTQELGSRSGKRANGLLEGTTARERGLPAPDGSQGPDGPRGQDARAPGRLAVPERPRSPPELHARSGKAMKAGARTSTGWATAWRNRGSREPLHLCPCRSPLELQRAPTGARADRCPAICACVPAMHGAPVRVAACVSPAERGPVAAPRPRARPRAPSRG